MLYLHATPMTEPLLFAHDAEVRLAAHRLGDGHEPRRVQPSLGWWMVAACLTRYEAWPIVGALVVLALIARWRRGTPLRD